MNPDQLIIDINFKNRIIDERRPPYFDNYKMFDLLSASIINKRTLEMIEIHELFKAVDHTKTHVGAARLFHSLNSPSESLELILAKQAALKEIESNNKLSEALENYLFEYQQGEKNLFRILNAHHLPMFPYRDLKKAMQTINTMQTALINIPRPESGYLDSLLKLIENFGKSPVFDASQGPAFRTTDGIKSRQEITPFTPALRFRRGRISGGSIWPALPSLFFAGAGFSGYINEALSKSMVLLTGGGIVLGFLYGVLMKPMVDNETAVLPLRKRLLDSNRFTSSMEAIACIDELISFKEFRKSVSYPTVIPEITDSERHYFIANNLRNPISAVNQEDFIPNDVSLDNMGITFITGPNSGGKTTFCKTIAQSQLLAQIGAPIVAESATINIADQISYQAPSFDSLNDPEGRFGTELSITKKIFFATTPKSLVFLDEIAEGTTTHERLNFSIAILNGFLAKYNNTVLVTHSYELAESYRSQGKGQYLKVEFKDDNPTHKMLNGISRNSQAERVAKKIGLSQADIQKHLEEEGYI